MGYISEEDAIRYIESPDFIAFTNNIAIELEVDNILGRIKLERNSTKVNRLACINTKGLLKDIYLDLNTIKSQINGIYPFKMETGKRVAILREAINFLISHELVHLQQLATTKKQDAIQKLIRKKNEEKSNDKLEIEANKKAYEIMKKRSPLSEATAIYMMDYFNGKFNELNSNEKLLRDMETFPANVFD